MAFEHYEIHRNNKVYLWGQSTFIAILVLHGTYFRVRETDELPALDWLVVLRLLSCLVGFLLGIVLISKRPRFGFGTITTFCYVLATGISALASEYPIQVTGYFVLLLGAGTLMAGLLCSAREKQDLQRLETAWWVAVTLLIVKDAIIGFFFIATPAYEDIARLGMGVTHANQMGLLSALAFWVSMMTQPNRKRLFLWLLRVFLLLVLFSTVSRTSIGAFFLAGVFYFVFKGKGRLETVVIPLSGMGVGVVLLLLVWSFGSSWTDGLVRYLQREQNAEELTSLTGRTYVWQHALKKSLIAPITGTGYGVTRFTMGELPKFDGYQPPHCHNEYLEVLLGAGLLGIIPFLLMIGYSLSWIFSFSRMVSSFSVDFALHAVCVMVILTSCSFLETNIAGRLTPVQPLFFLYLLSLDLRVRFAKPVSQSDPAVLSLQGITRKF